MKYQIIYVNSKGNKWIDETNNKRKAIKWAKEHNIAVTVAITETGDIIFENTEQKKINNQQ